MAAWGPRLDCGRRRRALYRLRPRDSRLGSLKCTESRSMPKDKDKNYRPSDREPFMNERQRDYFRQKLGRHSPSLRRGESADAPTTITRKKFRDERRNLR